ncbi:lipase member M-like [Eublepharis macularius]|uniref:Lipase member M-like n=1 Tax=Eublepharis macularius TaxID=481883 RepID=A0AA97JM24_EUBMA|nr:lipase member M-like [Eublepharis macularius]
MWLLLIMMAFQRTSEKIKYWGYPSEEYEVLTVDGYYLTLNRIPGGASAAVQSGSKAAILLMHCLLMEGSVWVANLPNNSLGFMLADAGYDVWIGNNRGNSWSRRHQHLTIDQEEFWDFSIHEMGIYDLSAITNFVLQKSKQEKIYYAGHAQGSSIELSLLSPRLRAFVAQKCSQQLIDVLCKQALFLFSGFNEKNLNESRADVYVSRFPDYTSVKTLIHWTQVAKAGKPRYFDYGPENLDKYNQTTPPLYRIEDITVPIAMWSGGQDWVCQLKETEELKSRLKSVIHYKHFPDWNHWDFIWGLDAPQRLYMEILNLMEN